ncbi:MAG TPA: sugar phosphate isomerase/epimerase [Bacteroidales bacterium]|nr:sugar phosphate isomerase/epimerase [Bacteroidales bacterium]
MNRRDFIRNSVTATAALSFVPISSCMPADPKTGLILYTVRNEMKADPEGTLDRIAELGFNWLEAASYADGKFYNMKPSKFRGLIEDRGMELISSHNDLNPGNVDEVVGASVDAGLKYVVIPSLPGSWTSSPDGFKEAAGFMNGAGEKCRSAGIRLGFHNHQVEFIAIDGIIPFDILAGESDPELVTYQLDLAWIVAAGQDPLNFFRKYPGRFEMWHIKDLSDEGKDATLGEGSIDFNPIFYSAAISGMKYFFIEQDDCRSHTPLESIKISREYLLNQIL